MVERIPADSGELIGQRLGRYLISSSLGRGGMAEVFKASDERLNRQVAIKVVLPIYGSEPDYCSASCARRRSSPGFNIPTSCRSMISASTTACRFWCYR